MSTVPPEPAALPRRRPFSGVRRRTMRAAAALVGLLALAGLVGCGTSEPSKPDMIDAFVTAGIPRAEATCAADAIFGSLSKKQVRQLVDRGAGGVPIDDPNKPDEATDKLNTAMAKCAATQASTPATGGPVSTTETTTTSVPAGETPTTSGPSFTTTTTIPSTGATTIAPSATVPSTD